MYQSKKLQKQVQNRSKSVKIVIVAAIIFIAVILSVILIISNLNNSVSKTGGALRANNQSSVSQNGELVIDKKDLSEKAAFYPVTIDGTKLEVIAVKASDGSIRTAFNTCQVCYSSGRGYYKQSGDELECQNCGNRFTMDDVELTKGGCNPVPIGEESKIVTDSTITISAEYLSQAKSIFANWKS